MGRWRDQMRDRLAWWPMKDRVLTVVAMVIVGVIAYSLLGQHTGQPTRTVADATSTTSVAVPQELAPTVAPTTTDAPPTTAVPATTAPATTAPATTTPATTTPPATSLPASTAPATTAPATTTTTVRGPVATAPSPSTTSRVGPFCGFVPGAIVDIDLNGQPSGKQTADANGCVTVNR